MKLFPVIFAACVAVASPQAASAQVWYGTSTSTSSGGGYSGVTSGAASHGGGGVTIRGGSGGGTTAIGTPGRPTSYAPNGTSTGGAYDGVVTASQKEKMTQDLINDLERKYGPICEKSKKQAARVIEEKIQFDQQMSRIRESALRNVEERNRYPQSPYRQNTTSYPSSGPSDDPGM